VEITGLRLPVRHEVLQALCNEWLNDPFPQRGYAYAPAADDIVIECLDYGSMRSANPPPGVSAADVGRQRELVFRVLVGRVDEGNRVARRPAVFCPFVFVDSSWSLISGREVVGYPKELAKFQTLSHELTRRIDGCRIFTPRSTADRASEDLLVTLDFRAKRDPISIDALFADAEAMTRARAAVSSNERTRKPLDQVRQAWWGLADLQSNSSASEPFIRSWLEGGTHGYGFVQLKRLPDAHTPDVARYHELLEGDYVLDRLDVAFPEHRASVHFGDENKVRQAFGLAQDLEIPPGSWYRASSDFRLRVTDPLR